MKNKEVKMKRESVIEILRDHKKVLQQKYGVIKIGVFGSYARNQQRADSDIDIAIEIIKEKKNLHNFLSIKRELERILGKKVDLGIESTLKPIIKEYVSKDIIYV